MPRRGGAQDFLTTSEVESSTWLVVDLQEIASSQSIEVSMRMP